MRGLGALVLLFPIGKKTLVPYLEKPRHFSLVERLRYILDALSCSMVYLFWIFSFYGAAFLVILFACIFLGFMWVRFESFTLRPSLLSDYAPAWPLVHAVISLSLLPDWIFFSFPKNSHISKASITNAVGFYTVFRKKEQRGKPWNTMNLNSMCWIYLMLSCHLLCVILAGYCSWVRFQIL